MPMEIEHEGKKLTVYTKDELDTAVAGAKTGLLSEDEAKKLADSAAAKARREAEADLKKLQEELAKSGNSAERIAELEKQITEQAGKLACSEKMLSGIKALTKGGMTVEQAEFLLQHPKFADAKFDSEDGVKTAMESAAALGIKPSDGKPPTPPANGAKGSPSETGNTPQTANLRGALQEFVTAKP